jgi:hypothetical protein
MEKPPTGKESQSDSESQESVQIAIRNELRSLREGLPQEFQEYAASFLNPEDKEEIKESFHITDLSTALNEEETLILEANGLLKSLSTFASISTIPSWGKEPAKRLEQIVEQLYSERADGIDRTERKPGMSLQDRAPLIRDQRWRRFTKGGLLLNRATNGAFLDNHNFNHVVSAASVKYRGASFDPSTSIEQSSERESESAFFVNAGHNPWSEGRAISAVVLNPLDMHARSFVHTPELEEWLVKGTRSVRKSFSHEDHPHPLEGYGPKHDNYTDEEFFYSCLFLAGYPINEPKHVGTTVAFSGTPTWADISTLMVNLHAGRLYDRKTNEDAQEQAKAEMRRFRDLVQKHLGISSEEDAIVL